jgi:PAS domain S-box-containing protein
VAALTGAAALALTLWIDPVREGGRFIFFFGAVAVSAWFGGMGPALVATVLAVAAVGYLLLPPAHGLRPANPADLVPLGVFALVAILVALLTERLRRARAHAEVAAGVAGGLAEQLRVQAAELEQQTEEAQALTEELEQTNLELQRALAEADGARRNAEESERRFRYTADTAPVLIWTSGTEPACDWFNKPWLDFTGRTMEEELGSGWAEGVHPDDLQPYLDVYLGAFDARRPFTMEHRLRRHDGEYRWVLDNGVPRFASDGAFLGYVGSCVDITDLRAADDAVRASEARYRALVEAGAQIVWTADASGMVTDIPQWRALTGQSRGEVRGFGWLDAIHLEDRGRTERAWRSAVSARTAYEAEYRLRGSDGSYRWYLDRGVPVLGDDGAIREWVGVCVDVHERRRVEARMALLDEAARVVGASLDVERTLATLARLAVPTLADYCSVDLLTDDGRIRRVEAAHVVAGKEAVLRDLWRRYPYDPSGREGVPEVLRTRRPAFVREIPDEATAAFARDQDHLRLLCALAPRSYICVPLIARGRAFGALSFVMADSEQGGSGRRYDQLDLDAAMHLGERAAAAVDNARLYAAEQAARQAAEAARTHADEARARAAFLADASERLATSLDYRTTLEEVASLAVPRLADWCFVEMVEDGAIRTIAVAHQDPEKVQLGWEVMTRYPIDPAAPYGTAKVLRTGEAELSPEIRDGLLAAVAQDVEHLRLLRETGFRSHVSVPLVVRGRPVGVLSLVTAESGRTYDADDLALAQEVARRASAAVERAMLYAEAQAANRAKGEFLAVMSHELRTPLNAIVGYAQLIELGVHGPVTEEQRQDLERIRHSQQHLLNVISGILDFTRVEAGEVHYDIQGVVVHEVIAAAEAMIEPQARTRSIIYECAPLDPPLVVRADRDRLQQILLNLLSNALKFTDGGGRIGVECAARHDRVAITVHDTGRGIPADKLGVIFEPFVQLDQSLTRRTDGTGLGLAISRDLARAMGGDLVVESAVGRGSAFTIVLPRVPVVDAHRLPPPERLQMNTEERR